MATLGRIALGAALAAAIGPWEAGATGVVFSAEQTIASNALSTRNVHAADIDGDGDLDALSASLLDDTVAWYANTDGQGSFGPKQVISTTADAATSVFAADVDGDGDLDVLSSSSADDKLAWYENVNGLGSFGPQQVIATTGDGARSVFAADIDGDGDLDVLLASTNDDTIAWYRNLDGEGTFSTEQIISTALDGAWFVTAADIDSDGDLDVLATSLFIGYAVWFRNTNGLGVFSAAQNVAIGAAAPASMSPADVDRDGDLDVLLASTNDDTIAWYENTDGVGAFGPEQVITTTADGAQCVVGADFDGDGDIDALSASSIDDTLAWYENTDGQGSFGPENVISTTGDAPFSAFAGDVDGDGDLDVLSASSNDNTVAWYENRTIGSSAAWSGAGNIDDDRSVVSVATADVDGDGDLDALALQQNVLFFAGQGVWYENLDGRGVFGPKQEFASLESLRDVAGADLDGDGDGDAIASSGSGIRWYENTDGQGSTWTEHVIGAGSSFVAADVDGDGDWDILAASQAQAIWYPNVDGLGTFGPAQVVGGHATNVSNVFAGDVDGDGDLDALSASLLGGTVFWHENADGEGSFGTAQLIATSTTEFPNSVFGGDFDSDGDLDVIVGFEAPGNFHVFTWYKNTDGQGSFAIEDSITISAQSRVSAVADVDGDGDHDFVTKSTDTEPEIVWYENEDGLGDFAPAQPIASAQSGGLAISAADIDGDGDVDLLASNEGISWYENADGQGGFAPLTIGTTGPTASLFTAAFAADVENDGDLDVLLSHSNTIVWRANTDGQGTFGTEQAITTAFGATSVFAADLDGDSDSDVLSAGASRISWHENTDGQGTFSAPQTISTTAGSAMSVLAADVDGDGDLDALYANFSGDTIAWYENTDGQGSFGSVQSITTAADGATSVFAADIDGDGDVDALSASTSDHTIAWHENTDGQGTSWAHQTILAPAFEPKSVLAADVDGDGDLDALSIVSHDHTIAWFENTDGQGSFGPAQTISTTALAVRSLSATDVDRDGDVDVVSTIYDTLVANSTITWFENTDGQGSFGADQSIDSATPQGLLLVAADVDGDGDVDVMYDTLAVRSPTPQRLAWNENRSGQATFSTYSAASGAHAGGELVTLLGVEVHHEGVASDPNAELASLALQLDAAPATTRLAHPAGLLDGAAADAVIESLFVYRDDGSGQLEPGSDALVATVPTLSLVAGRQNVAFTNADPGVQVPAAGSALFFVAAELSSVSAPPRTFRVRHLSDRSEVHHSGTNLVLRNAPSLGAPPLALTVLDPAADEDGDGLSNGNETQVHGSDPLNPDSDYDGLTDGNEVNVHGTNPIVVDTDGDGLSDGAEVNTHGTNPILADSEGDGLVDGAEIAAGTDPFDADSDDDGLRDGDEVNVHGTDPLDPNGDADADTIPDAEEVARGMHPLFADTDRDGFLDAADNCPSAYNPDQLDRAGFGTPLPDGVGDLCQNADFNRDGEVNILDVTLERRGLVGLEPALDPALPPSTP